MTRTAWVFTVMTPQRAFPWWTFSFWWVTFTPLVPWWARHSAGRFDSPHGSILIVLGAASGEADGILSYSSYLRAAYAVRAYREGWVREM